MTTLLIKRKNAFTQAEHKAEIVFNQTLTTETIEQIHWLLETSHPDDQIDLHWGSNFIVSRPLHMKMDESMVGNGSMTYETFVTKWCMVTEK
jgi:hypothetical protein